MLALCVVFALAAGLSFAVGAVLQQSAAGRAPRSESLSWRLIVSLAHQKVWVVGIVSDVFSFALQAVALSMGPIALVQPLAVSGILFSVPLAVRWRGKRLHRLEWFATVLVAAGLSMFLAAASPSSGVPETSFAKWVLILIAVGGLMTLGVALGKISRGVAKPALYALAAGSAFGLLAALTKASTHLLGQGAGTFFTAWQPYAMAGVAAAGIIIQQSAFQAGPLPASVPVMDTVEPTVAVLIGVFAFAETVSTTPAALVFEAIGIAALLIGIVLLDRSPVVLDLQEAGQADSRARSSSGNSGNLEATVSRGNSS